jgi:hypothetical protein
LNDPNDEVFPFGVKKDEQSSRLFPKASNKDNSSLPAIETSRRAAAAAPIKEVFDDLDLDDSTGRALFGD